MISKLLLLGHPSSPPHVHTAGRARLSAVCRPTLSCPFTPLCRPLQWISLLLCVLSFKCHSASSYQSLYLRLLIHIAPSLPSPSAGLWPRQLAVALSSCHMASGIGLMWSVAPQSDLILWKRLLTKPHQCACRESLQTDFVAALQVVSPQRSNVE